MQQFVTTYLQRNITINHMHICTNLHQIQKKREKNVYNKVKYEWILV